MKTSTALGCLAILLGCASNSLAQFTPVVAKIKVRSFQMQSDGTEKPVLSHVGFYFRSSAGDEMTTHFPVTEKGKASDAGQSTFVDSLTGKIYSLTHTSRKAKLVQQKQLPLRPDKRPPHPDRIVGEDVINGVKCITVLMESNDGSTPVGKVWLSKDAYLEVKMEFNLHGRRLVRELYDIQFTEPDPSMFGIPSTYAIDDSECRGCSQGSSP